MTNSDNTFGTYNKATNQMQQHMPTPWTKFASVDEAKTFFFTDAALAVFEKNCTNLQWALVSDHYGDNTKLKYTYDFGTKGSPTQDASSDHAETFKSEKDALQTGDMSGWFKRPTSTYCSTLTEDSDHLF